MEPFIVIKCLERDADILEEIAPECVRRFKQVLKEQLGEERELELSVSRNNFMKKRELKDYTDLHLSEFGEEQEEAIKIKANIDHKLW